MNNNNKKSLKIAVSILSLLNIFCAAPLHAQGAPRLQSGTLQDENKITPEINKSPSPSFRVDRKNDTMAETLSSQKFFVNGYVFEGNTIFDRAELYHAIGNNYNKELSLGELYHAADRITKLYSDKGYAFSFAIIPVQNVANGFVKIVIIEGKISAVNVRVKGNALVSKNRIENLVRRNFETLISDAPVKSSDLEKAALITRDALGKNTTVIVSPDRNKSGSAILNIEVSVENLDISANYDDYIRDEFGDNRYGGNIKVRSVLVAGDKFGLNYRQSNYDKAFKYNGGYYEFPFFRPDLSINLSSSFAKTQANKGLLSILEFKGSEKTDSIAIKWSRTRTRSFTNILSVNLDAVESKSGILGTTLIDDKVRNLDVNSDWSWWLGDGSRIDAGISLSTGIYGLGATQSNDSERSRITEDPKFTALKGNLDVSKPFMNGHLVATSYSEFQMGNGLGAAASRECSFGGESYGYAYDAGTLGGENCFKTKLRIDSPFKFGMIGLSPFIVGEYGWATQSGALDFGEKHSLEAGSYGGGLGISFGKYFYGELVTVKPTNELLSINKNKQNITKISFGLKFN